MADEEAIRTLCTTADYAGALTAALQRYGDELFGFLCGLARDRAQADDVFSATCEAMWRALPGFRWESSLRTWMYRIARNEFLSANRKRQRRGEVPLSTLGSVQAIIDKIRTTTPEHARTTIREKFAQLREELEPDDHMLLGLRIDRGLAWNEIAKVLAETDATPSAREVAMLRKRYERLKARLRERMRDA